MGKKSDSWSNSDYHSRDPLRDTLRAEKRVLVTVNTLLRTALGLPADTSLRVPLPVPRQVAVDFLQQIAQSQPLR
jgi:hypothetical protein